MKFIDCLARLEIPASAAIFDTFSRSALAHFAHGTVEHLHAITFATRAINHFGREIVIVYGFPFDGGFFPQRLVVVLRGDIGRAFATIQAAIGN